MPAVGRIRTKSRQVKSLFYIRQPPNQTSSLDLHATFSLELEPAVLVNRHALARRRTQTPQFCVPRVSLAVSKRRRGGEVNEHESPRNGRISPRLHWGQRDAPSGWPCGVWEEGRRAVAGSSRRIHEYLDLNMNRERSFYHEYEYENAAAIMSMNSKRKAIFNSTHMNTLVFMTCPGLSAPHPLGLPPQTPPGAPPQTPP